VNEESERIVMVSVGTDHHRFDRLMTWVEQWIRSAPADTRVIVQHGTSRCPSGAVGHTLLPPQRLLQLMRSATAVVVQGGPGGITDSIACGRKPIVVPRTAALREAVDDHQIPFCQHLARLGQVVLATDEKTLHRALDTAISDPDAFRSTTRAANVTQTVTHVDRLISDLVKRRARRRWLPGALRLSTSNKTQDARSGRL
jgi:UDP-N-acetylglucosamine transferase subunit ALG13